jgi:DNA-binding transcriptional LysR family regulator
MDRFSCMQAFVSVVEAGGFSEAARRLKVSKALISKQVGQLEDSLGVRLLHRTTRKVSPSSNGRAYYEQCRPLLEELNALDASLRSRDRDLLGELRITAPTTYAELHVMPVISHYAKAYPQVRITLDLTDRFVNLVEERIDLAIRIGKLEESSLVSRRIGETRMYLCASPHYLRDNGEPQQLAELMAHPCIIDSNHPEGNLWRLRDAEGEQLIRVDDQIQVNNAGAARELVVSGNGIGLLPSFAVDADIANGRLQRVLPAYSTDAIGIYALYLHRKHLSPKVRSLLDMLVGSTDR